MKHPLSLTQRQESETLNSLTPPSGVGGLLKKLFLSAGLVLAMSGALRAQDCATGYCPATITVHHKVDAVSPVTVDITYGVVATSLSGTQQCWITRNLGATTQATAWTDATAASAGWYWQFNRKQGYSYSTGSRVPNTTWITPISESSDWVAANDPCTLLLGSTWRLPIQSELTNVLNSIGNGATNYLAWYSSVLKMHAAGYFDTTPTYYAPGTTNNWTIYWTATASTIYNGYGLNATASNNVIAATSKPCAAPVRCLRTY